MRKLLDLYLSVGYIGYLPFFPGTFASAACSLFVLALPSRSFFFDFFFLFLAISLSALSISFYRPERRDPPHIVIDEFIGMYITMVSHRTNLYHIFAGFILFRFFDIMKPFPVSKAEKIPGGLGILADDILAGICANLSLHMLKVLPWKVL